eukprot:4764919-Prymnesium_polylepis.1
MAPHASLQTGARAPATCRAARIHCSYCTSKSAVSKWSCRRMASVASGPCGDVRPTAVGRASRSS